MRKLIGAVGCLLAVAGSAPQPAEALDRHDTMVAWLHATDAERTHLLDELQDHNSSLRRVDRAAVMDCMNGAAAIAMHRDLPIAEVAEACSEPPSPSGEKPSSDI